MPIKSYKPTTPARRGMTTRDNDELTAKRGVKSLRSTKKAAVGRNSQGRITIRHRGGGVKRFYRHVDFKSQDDVTAKVVAIEYDPNRSANIALLEAEDGKFSYVLAAAGLKVGASVTVGEKSAIKTANRLPLRAIPMGSSLYNIELNRGKGGQLVRSAGAKAQLVAKEGDYGQVRLPSGEVRLVHLDCYASLGSVGNAAHQNIKWGSAGRRRRMGWRPSVRGKAMNPADHPMGGGEGQSSPGRLPRTPWGKIAIGPKTRRRKQTDKMIVRSRKDGRR